MNEQDRTGARVAVVTGGASGIGASVVQLLSDQGMTVVVADIDQSAAERSAAALRDAGRQAFALGMDVGNPASIEAGFATVRADHGRCDVLVNSAGIAKVIPFLKFPLDNWLATMNINVTGTMLCSQHAAQMMVERGWGRIVNLASVAGMRAVGSGRTAYGTSKAAVIGLTRQIAAELAEHGVTVNAVCPGPIDTAMVETMHTPQFRAEYTKAIPAGRYGKTHEVAALVAFLVSDAAAYMTGVAIPVDGGFMATGARGV
jgi:NAD(P)-dependent dehydrogenase (short-subunit alcohol dehydrogenase family)